MSAEQLTDSHSELVAAARHLVQWGRTRQAVWQDASSDLLAALGNRYASFDDLQSEPLPPPPPAPRRQPVMPPELLAPVPLPAPVPAAVPAPRPAPPTGPAPAAAPAKSPVHAAPTATRAAAARRPSPARILLAAGFVLAAVASPSLWRAYEASRVVAPTTSQLTIETTPPGSTVLIDGIESGKTPLSTSLQIGVHRIELRYRKNVRTIDVDVVAGDRMVTHVDWTKRPAPKQRPAATDAAARRRTSAARPSNAAAPRDGQATAPPPEVVPPAVSSRPDDDRTSTTTSSDTATEATAPPAARP